MRFIFLTAILALSLCASGVVSPFIQSENGFGAKTFSGSLIAAKDGKIIHRIYAQEGIATFGEVIGYKTIAPLKPLEAKIATLGGETLNAYAALDMGAIAPNIYLRLEATSGGIEKLFTLERGARVGDLLVAIEGAKGVSVNGAGELVVTTAKGDAAFTKPVAYQLIGGKKQPVEVAYKVSASGYGFRLGKYDPRHGVIIDPLMAATYTGGAARDGINAVIVDRESKSVYVAGVTDSP
ncbi:MAG: hypothetical protein LBC09_00700, partial [Helicobacteraceae bacterium]|nr:hypothetical protein [Helicobacteraceae bacterium]